MDVVSARKSDPAADAATPAHELWHRLDLTRIGVFGHSFGRATSLMALSQDPRILAGIALDGWMVPVPDETIGEGIRKPVLYLGQERWDDPLNYEKLDRFIANSSGFATREIWAGTKHMDFADAPHLSNFAQLIGYAGTLPSEELRLRLNKKILSFFSTYLSHPLTEV